MAGIGLWLFSNQILLFSNPMYPQIRDLKDYPDRNGKAPGDFCSFNRKDSLPDASFFQISPPRLGVLGFSYFQKRV